MSGLFVVAMSLLGVAGLFGILYAVKGGLSSPEAALAFLDRQLPSPREQLAYAGAGGDSHYTAPWTQSYEDIRVRQFINRVSEHMGSHT